MHTITSRTPEELATKSDSSPRRGILLINLGTPNKPDVPSVRHYLAEFLSDPAVISLPTGFGWLNGLLGKTIARFRAPKSAEAYRKIWTDRGSPLGVITHDQATALQEAMPPGWQVFHAMRYGSPSIAQTLSDIKEAGIKELILISMYPQFSGPTTGTAQREVHSYLMNAGHSFELTTRSVWYDDHSYITSQASLITSYAKSVGLTPENCFLLFSTHGLPTAYVQKGDPYPEHIARTVALVGDQLDWPAERMSLAYQSRFGPVEWLQPATDNVLNDLGCAGEKKVLVCPISFTADCLETLEEIDMRYRKTAESAGAEIYLCPALNTYPPFIAALKHLALQGPTPMTCNVPSVAATQKSEADTNDDGEHIRSLIMIGVSAASRLGQGLGPDVAHIEADTLRQVKRPQCEVPELLKNIQVDSGLSEVMLWNTCHRIELYGWVNNNQMANGQVNQDAIKRHLFGTDTPSDLRVNIMRGRDAHHHLLRTAMGLNSDLPGERDVLDQLKAAYRLASTAGTANSFAACLLADATTLDSELRNQTTWGAYDLEYCTAAFSRIATVSKMDLRTSRVVVVGGSTTSAAALYMLRNRYDILPEQLTLLYRGHKHGRQIKLLRKAIGNGRRLRLQSYDEPQVLRTISEADLLIFGLDRKEPVISASQLRDVRDWTEQPLTVLDFNMFGSTVDLQEINGITVYDAKRLHAEVEAFANIICEQDKFIEAVETVESSIAEFVSRVLVAPPNTNHVNTTPISVPKEEVLMETSSMGALVVAAERSNV